MPPTQDSSSPENQMETESDEKLLKEIWSDITETLNKDSLDQDDSTRMEAAFDAVLEIANRIKDEREAKKNKEMVAQYKAMFNNKVKV